MELSMSSIYQEVPLHMNRDVPFVDCVFRIIEGLALDDDAVRILRQAEEISGLELSSVYPYPAPGQISEDSYYEVIDPNLEGFLNVTELVLDSYYFNQLFPIFNKGVYLWGQRAWAETISSWANKSNWLNKTDWDYLEFYNGLHDRLIENYELWAKTVLRVIRKKSEPKAQNLLPIVDEIIEALFASSDSSIREGAATTLASLGGEKAKAALLQASVLEKNETVQSSIRLLLVNLR
jgi:3-methyladenine DNA glycosylase AlkD